MKQINIDIETYSSVDLKKSGLYKYVQSPDFQILLFAYSVDGSPVKCVDLAQGEMIPAEIIEALADSAVIKKAFNAPFEFYCINKFYYSPIDQWRCTMLHSLYCGYAGKLEAVGPAIGIPEDKRKNTIGNALISFFCKPCKQTKKNNGRTRNLPHHEPEKWQLFKEYNIQDVVAEMEVEHRLSAFPVPDQEQKLWELDQRINASGITTDMELVESSIHCFQTITDELKKESVKLSGLNNPNSVAQLKPWIEKESGIDVPNMQAETVAELIEKTEGPVKRVLEIRQELAKSSVKKYQAMKEAVCSDGLIRGLLQFYGANRTGRWAGRIVQVHNLPRNYLETLDHAREMVKARKLDVLRVIYGNIPDTLSQLIRTALVPSPGNVLLVSDFSAIEARVIAWLAGEQWRLDVFNTHGKIYEASASQMFGIPLELIVKGNPEYDLRSKGKIAELALGYQGGPRALESMDNKKELDPDELPEIVRRWRSANKRIVDLWYSLENAALSVMRTGQPAGVKGMLIARESHHGTKQDFLTIKLPSSRKLFYAKPFLSENDFGKEAVHYHTVNQDTRKWEVTSTYGGKLVENVTQAIARDCLAESLVRLNNGGYQIAMHVHDEAVLDVPKDKADLEAVTSIMGQPISWAPGLPLKADGFITGYYMKD